MTRYRTRSRTPDLPPLLAAWSAGEPPPAAVAPTPAEVAQVIEAIQFGDADVDGRLTPLRYRGTSHPHGRSWSDWLREHRPGAGDAKPVSVFLS